MKTDRRCRWVARRLSLLAGGDLAGDERRRVERHLIACADCRGRRDAAARSVQLLRRSASAPAPAPAGIPPAGAGSPPSLWPALARQIREAKHRPAPSPLSRPWSALAGWMSASAWPSVARPSAGLGLGLAALLAVAAWSARPSSPVVDLDPAPAEVAAAIGVPPAADPLPPPIPSAADLAMSGDFAPIAADPGLLEELSPSVAVEPVTRPTRPYRSALPIDRAELAVRGGFDPFAPPTPLRYSYDLEFGFLQEPGQNNPQRSY